MKGLNFGRTRTVRGRGLPVPISLGARLQAARRVPQAVVKVASYAHGVKGVSQSIDYISREGELPLETEAGDIILGRAERKELVKNWSRDFDSRKRSRDSIHMVFSMPRGSDPEKLRAAVRKVVTDHFEGHEAVFAIHQDRPHPHAHVVMKMRNRKTGKKLRLGIFEIFQTRGAFAEAAREQGIELAVSSRAARGVGMKATGQAIHYMMQRGVVPQVVRQAAYEAQVDYERGFCLLEKPWEQAMRKRNDLERGAYQAEADRLRLLARQNEKDRALLLRASAALERFSKEMPEPRTRRQRYFMQIAMQITKTLGQPQPNRSQTRNEEMER